eukprot:c20676_g1_i2.p1 GENE.c20676_g1_i2~~c20676_g1_i2.p1  ORF type:complete len:280 (+),score=65.90 c20676_g1_i2:691-1530(+)
MLHRYANDAISEQRPELCKQKLRCVCDAIELSAALSSGRILEAQGTPHVSMLVHNDIMYTSHNAQLIAALYSSRHASHTRHLLASLLPIALLLQTQARTLHATHIRDSTRNITDVEGQTLIQMPMVMAHQMRHLAISWKVLPHHLMQLSLACVADVACKRIVNELLSAGDIPSDDCDPYRDAFFQLTATIREAIGTDVNDTDLFKLVPELARLECVAELLNAKLANIPEMRRSGQLRWLTADETVRLVEALFTETANRRSAIKEIRLLDSIQAKNIDKA